MLRRARSKNCVTSDINVTPMADIMLVLLIIFMITTPLLQDNISVNLPKARNPLEAKTDKSFVVTLTRDGGIYLGKMHVTEPEMLRVLSEGLVSEIDRTIFVRADQALQYGKVVDIVNECRNAGVQRIGLMTDREVH